MALELPYILGGSNPEQAAITLYGFLQQNILFDALSNKLSSSHQDSVSFLYDLSTLCSMIGMLVLIFSPSLWRAKYLVSWGFLFIAVYIGGSTGPEFSYNLARAERIVVINNNLKNDGMACPTDELVDGVCPKLTVARNIIEKAKLDMGIAQSTIASVVSKNINDPDGKYLTVDAVDGQATHLQVRGFFPQVYAMYATNRLRSTLEVALYDLNARNFNKRMAIIEGMLTAKVSNPQLGAWISVFDSLCSSAAKAPASALISADMAGINIAKYGALNKKEFTLNEALNAMRKVDILRESDSDIITPSIDLVNASVDEISNDEQGLSNIAINKKRLAPIYYDRMGGRAKELIQLFTVNAPDSDAYKNYMELPKTERENQTPPDMETFISDSFLISNEEIKDRIYNKINLYNSKSTKEIEKERIEFERIMGKDRKVGLLLPQYHASKYDLKTETVDNRYKGFQYMGADSSYTPVNNCGELLASISQYQDTMVSNNIKNFSENVKKELGTCDPSSQMINQGYLDASGQNTIVDKKTCVDRALKSEFGATETMLTEFEKLNLILNDDNSTDAEKSAARSEKAALKKAYKSASVSNAMADQLRVKSDYYSKQNNSMREGFSGDAYTIGASIVDAFDGPLAGLKSLGAGFKAGAYSVILPIIKNIIIAFILVMTPILFLLGLLVPTWAPGVIITSVITIVFLQMTDVVMVVIQAVLVSVETAITNGTSSLGIQEVEYQNFLEVIWAMAYVSTFAITAFMMFAAGNTKQIVSKMAGLDSTVQSTADSIAKEGWNMTKAAPGVAIGVASGGANIAGKALAFSRLANEEGLGTAVKGSMGSLTGEFQAGYITQNNKMTGTLSTEAANAKAMGLTSEQQKRIRDESIAKAEDKVLISTDEMIQDHVDRLSKKTRDKDANHAEKGNMAKATKKTVERAAGDHGVKGDEFKGRTFTKEIEDENGEMVRHKIHEKSVREIYEGEMYGDLRKIMGYKKGLPDKYDPKIGWSEAQYNAMKANNSKILERIPLMASAIAQGTYKHMDEKNITTDKHGNTIQKFDSSKDVHKSIFNNMSKVGMTKNEEKYILEYMNSISKTDKESGALSIKYQETLKNAIPRNRNKK